MTWTDAVNVCKVRVMRLIIEETRKGYCRTRRLAVRF